MTVDEPGSPDVQDVVSREAQAHRLGEPVDVRLEKSMGANVLTGLGVFAVGLTVSLLLARWNAAQTAAGSHHHLAVPSGALVVIGIGLVIRALVIGTRAHYLYTGGLIHRRRSGFRTVAWPDVHEMAPVHARNGTVQGYRVLGAGGTTITIPLKLDGGRDLFIDRVTTFLRQHDRPVR